MRARLAPTSGPATSRAAARRRRWRWRRAVSLLSLLVAAGCGDAGGRDPVAPARTPAAAAQAPAAPRIVTTRVGRGPQAAWIIRPDVDRPLPGVLFLHGWGATLPRYYGPWLRHLARRGHAVIYPRYQESVLVPPEQVLGNVIAGVRLALPQARIAPGSLVVAGHSAGGALAADYAAIAGVAKLPQPRAVLSMYAGRTLRGAPLSIPEVDPGRIPAGTRVVAMAGARDAIVGTRVARRIARGSGGEYVLIRDRAVADHLGPQRSGPASRRVFWRRLDRIIAAP